MMESYARRLPVYVLLDCSGSMLGEPIEMVRQGVRALITDLKDDPSALESAYLSFISFSSSAKQLCPLTELPNVKEPTLEAGGSTALGGALKILEQCVNNEVRKNTPEQKGDWKPLVFILTDGEPTDQWEDVADRIRKERKCTVIACAAGDRANAENLKRIGEHVVLIKNLAPNSLKEFFKWVTASIKNTSVSIGAGDPGLNLPSTPPDIDIIQ